jgi:hypothetical protein
MKSNLFIGKYNIYLFIQDISNYSITFFVFILLFIVRLSYKFLQKKVNYY